MKNCIQNALNCKSCGSELPSPDSDMCIKCGKIVEKPKTIEDNSKPVKRPSKAWYLVPIFFGIIGGLVMYLVLKDQDGKMAKKGLTLGIVLGVVLTVFVIIIYAVIFGYLFLLSTPKVQQDTNTIVVSGSAKFPAMGLKTIPTHVAFNDVDRPYSPVENVPVIDGFYTAKLPINHNYKIIIQYTIPSLYCQQTANGCIPTEFACDAGILKLNSTSSNLQKDVKC